MKYLLDTNALSEALRPRPEPAVARWFEASDDNTLYLSVVSLAEIRRGLALLAPGKRRERLEHWLTSELIENYHGRIFDVDLAVGLSWGDLMARQRMAGRNAHPMDMFIAATALVHGCALVTRNVRDFENLDVAVLNPWNI